MQTAQKGIAAKLIVAMKAVDVVTKGGRNTQQGYSYVRAADVATECRKALYDAGIAFTYDVIESSNRELPTKSGGVLQVCELTALLSFIDQETGEKVSVKAIGSGVDSLEKAPYKAMTGALKYGLRMTLMIPDEEDPENDKNGHHEIAQRPAPARAVAPAQTTAKPVGDALAKATAKPNVMRETLTNAEAKEGKFGPSMMVEWKGGGRAYANKVDLFDRLKKLVGIPAVFKTTTKTTAKGEFLVIDDILGEQTEITDDDIPF